MFGVAVGGADEGEDELAVEQGLAVHFDSARGGAHHPLKRRAIAKDFFDGGFEEVHVGAEEGELGGVVKEADNGVVDEICGGFLPPYHQKLKEAEDFFLGEMLAIDFGFDEF